MVRKVLLSLLVSCAFIWIGCNNGNNTPSPTVSGPPTIFSFTPGQVDRGEINATGTIQGSNLGGTTAVHLGDGIKVVQLTPISSSEVSVKFDVPDNAKPG